MDTKVTLASFFVLCTLMASAQSASFINHNNLISNMYSSLRPAEEPKIIMECGEVTEPYGTLHAFFKDGAVADGAGCGWTLRAPKNHVIDIINVRAEVEDPVAGEKQAENNGGSDIFIHDSAAPGGGRVHRFKVNLFADSGYGREGYHETFSSSENVFVEALYHKHPNYQTQKVFITYQMYSRDDVNRLRQIQSKNA